jgi:TPR repeat protein
MQYSLDPSPTLTAPPSADDGAVLILRAKLSGESMLRLDVNGFALSGGLRTWQYAWAELAKPVWYESWKAADAVYFSTRQHGPSTFDNVYGVPSSKLVTTMNRYRNQALGLPPASATAPQPAKFSWKWWGIILGIAGLGLGLDPGVTMEALLEAEPERLFSSPAQFPAGAPPAGFNGTRPDLPQATKPARRKNLPAMVWILILTVFTLTIMNIQAITLGLWRITAPAGYAAHMLDDQTLTDKAGFDPRLLPVLLARADAGDKSAMYHYGDIFDPTDFTCETTVPKNVATSIYWYSKAVVLDDQGAERALGILYHEGIGVGRDDVEAAALFERAVGHNDDFGDYYLGTMLENGQGEPVDLPRAVALEQASAAQGQALGQVELGRIYFYGIGTARDYGKAEAEWKLAAAQGDTAAQNLLARNGMQ